MKEKKIATSTPVAQGLLGHKIGDIVEIMKAGDVIPAVVAIDKDAREKEVDIESIHKSVYYLRFFK